MNVAGAALGLAMLGVVGCYRSHERRHMVSTDAGTDVVDDDAEVRRCVRRSVGPGPFAEIVGPIAPFPAHRTPYADTAAAWLGGQLVLGSAHQLVGSDGRPILPPGPFASRGVIRILGDTSDCYAEREVILSPDPGGPISLDAHGSDDRFLLGSSITEGFVFAGSAGARSLMRRLSGLPLGVFGEAVVTPGGEILGFYLGGMVSMLAWGPHGEVARVQELPVFPSGLIGLGRSADRIGVVDFDPEGARAEFVFYEREGAEWREAARLDAPHIWAASLSGHFNDAGDVAMGMAYFRPEERDMFPRNPGTLLVARRGADGRYRLTWLDVGADLAPAVNLGFNWGWADGARIARPVVDWAGTGTPFVLVEDLHGDVLAEVFRWTPEPVPPCTGGVRVTAIALSAGDERLAVSLETECLPGELGGWDALQATFVFE